MGGVGGEGYAYLHINHVLGPIPSEHFILPVWLSEFEVN